MGDGFADLVRAIPAESFREPASGLAHLTGLERLRWLQQTARFVWMHRGAARGDRAVDPPAAAPAPRDR
jgi:hypothetical protein